MDPLDLAAIGTDLARLTDLLRDAQMRVPGRAADAFRAERDEVLLTFDGYLEPRIGAPDAPIVVAIVGPTGAGKSTLLNSIAHELVSHGSVVRPTTRHPMVWADVSHPDEYWSDFSERAARHLGRHVDAVLGESPLTEHLTVIDTPPLRLDGQVGVAAQAVAISDLCIFVTTPTRYADGLAWDFLKRTRRRGVPILFVLNRLPADLAEQDELLTDFATRLHQRRLLAAPDPTLLFGVAEGEIERSIGGLEAESVAAIRKELAEVADPVYRYGLVDETVYATARMVAERARALTRPMAAELPLAAELTAAVADAYQVEADALRSQLERGDLAGAARHFSWPDAADDLAAIVTRRAGSAAHAAAAAWSRYPEAAELVVGDGSELWRHGGETPQHAALALASWKSWLDSALSEHARPGWLRWQGARRRAIDAVWRSVLTGDPVTGRSQRKLVDGGATIVAAATDELVAAMQVGLDSDAARFATFIGADSADDLYAAIVERADLVDARLDQLAGQIPEAWTEPVDDVEVVDDVAGDAVPVQIGEGSTVVELGGEQLYRRIVQGDGTAALPDAPVEAEPGQ